MPLDEAALLIAAHARPDLDVAAAQDRLDRLAHEVPAPTVDALRHHLFAEARFSGNHADYYDPRNSYLDQVLERGAGIPITLSVLMIEVGRRLEVPLAAVSMPGHFLVGDQRQPDRFVDPFDRGAVLDRSGCEARFRAIHPPGTAFEARFLEPVPTRSVLARMLANLDAIATARADRTMLAWVVRLRTCLPGASPAEHRRLASVLAASCRFGEAADVLERLAAHTSGRAGDEDVADARRLRARLN